MSKKKGKQTIFFDNLPKIVEAASVVGRKENEGNLAGKFDYFFEDAMCNCESWEQGESEFVKKCIDILLKKSGKSATDIDFVIAGDLMNQVTSTTFGVKSYNIPYFGLFGACSVIGEGLSLGSMLLDGDFVDNIIIGASSHFCTAEKQFRFPLQQGTQRPPSSTWTVTGSGFLLLSKGGCYPQVEGVTVGKVVDKGITDVNNMGAAMAPAAIDTLTAHFNDTKRSPDYYDVIATGDLGYIGKQIVLELMHKEGFDLRKNLTDCGIIIFDKEKQDTHSGGSGCACSAVTFASYFYPKLKSGEIKKMLLIPTGALLSTTSSAQGLSIPSIAHAISLTCP